MRVILPTKRVTGALVLSLITAGCATTASGSSEAVTRSDLVATEATFVYDALRELRGGWLSRNVPLISFLTRSPSFIAAHPWLVLTAPVTIFHDRPAASYRMGIDNCGPDPAMPNTTALLAIEPARPAPMLHALAWL